jgi:hypothetical protein
MQLALRVIAILSFVVGIVWVIVDPGFEPLLAFLAGVTTLLISFGIDKTKETTETLDERNRRVMLDHVENFWVKGVREKSLHGAALLELGIKEDPGAVRYPWTIKKEVTNEPLPAGKSMLEIFTEIGAGRSLLVLGAPGAGKTTMLLELARGLIERAREKESEPIPVVFNLASWTETQTLPGWLAEQLNLVYYVPKKLAPSWVEGNKMLLLLDGLDEGREDRRAACVEAINRFRKEYGFTPLAVCCRIEEYNAIDAKLAFEGAVTIQPLTPEQVDAYILRLGSGMGAVRLALKRDRELQELAGTPLMLSIMALAYKDLKPEDLRLLRTVEQHRAHLFDTYIERMFERSARSANVPFPKQETLRYLSWLASKMIQYNLTTYQIEAMQPFWLENKLQNRLYQLLFREESEINMVDRLSWSFKEARNLLKFVLRSSISIRKSYQILIWPLFLGGVFWVLGGTWSAGLVGILIGTLWLGITSLLLGGLSSKQIEETTHPGQRLKQTYSNAMLVVVSTTLAFGLTIMIGIGFNKELYPWMIIGMVWGGTAGLAIGWDYGVRAIMHHHTLRFFLVWNQLLPQRIFPFLEHAVNLIFLRRVGGSYIFVHRLLMEHFAEMGTPKRGLPEEVPLREKPVDPPTGDLPPPQPT